MATTNRPKRRSNRPALQLCAGSVECCLSEGDLRYLRIGALEIVRRVYFVTRDPNWGNVPQVITAPRISRARNRFTIVYDAQSTSPGIGMAWTCRIAGEPDGSITYSITGRALTSFMANRIGLCVHLPLEGFAGNRYQLVNRTGRVRTLALSKTVSPHQPCTDIHALRFQLPGRTRLELTFTGDQFEIEDQRNWIDGSYKIYSRPLARPFPFKVKTGDTFSQTLRITTRTSNRRKSGDGETIIRIGRPGRQTAPAIGTSLPPGSIYPHQTVPRALASIGLSHLRADLDDFGRGLEAQVARATRAAIAATAPLELALFLSRDVRREVSALAEVLRRERPAVIRFLVFGADTTCTPAAALQTARAALGRLYPGVSFVSGTDFNFAELNRGRASLPRADAVNYSANPQVHASDELSMVECLEGLRHSLDSARTFFPQAALSLSVLTLKPRKNPVATVKVPDSPARRYDPRQGSAFCAALTAAALGILQEVGVASATLYETAGGGGLASNTGKLAPVGRMLGAYLACRAQAVRPMRISHPLRVGGWARANTALIANLTAETRQVVVELPGGSARRQLRLGPYALQSIGI